MNCPNCKAKLVKYTLNLLQCPKDWTVYEKRKRLIKKIITENAPTFQADYDEVNAQACPVKGCD